MRIQYLGPNLHNGKIQYVASLNYYNKIKNISTKITGKK